MMFTGMLRRTSFKDEPMFTQHVQDEINLGHYTNLFRITAFEIGRILMINHHLIRKYRKKYLKKKTLLQPHDAPPIHCKAPSMDLCACS
mmetsp:Transcript_43841/g.64357  ORF Transcript_43841/g.64357 Transcript_43841/m.64357 type:complete len:89 (+) Transcript_43841:192-458(+)